MHNLMLLHSQCNVLTHSKNMMPTQSKTPQEDKRLNQTAKTSNQAETIKMNSNR